MSFDLRNFTKELYLSKLVEKASMSFTSVTWSWKLLAYILKSLKEEPLFLHCFMFTETVEKFG